LKFSFQNTNPRTLHNSSGSLTDKRIIVHEVVQRARAERKSADDLSRLDHFTSIRHNSEVYEVYYAIAKHFRMNSEITVVRQLGQNCVRD